MTPMTLAEYEGLTQSARRSFESYVRISLALEERELLELLWQNQTHRYWKKLGTEPSWRLMTMEEKKAAIAEEINAT